MDGAVLRELMNEYYFQITVRTFEDKPTEHLSEIMDQLQGLKALHPEVMSELAVAINSDRALS